MNHDRSIVWLGFHTEGAIALQRLCKQNFPLKAIITLNDEEAKKRSGVFDISAIAKQYDIPLYKITNINHAESIDLLNTLRPDVLFVIGWSQILSKPALESSQLVVGAHASLLPHNRGSAPINWAIIHGEECTGNSLMVLSEGVDSGDIIAQRSFDITLYDSCNTLYDKVAETNADMILELLNKLDSGTFKPIPQGHTDEPILPRRRPRDGIVNWDATAMEVYNFIRAITAPYPGAYSQVNGKMIHIWNVSFDTTSRTTGRPGSVAGFTYSYIPENCAVNINCRQGTISIHQISDETGNHISGQQLITLFTSSGGFDA